MSKLADMLSLLILPVLATSVFADGEQGGKQDSATAVPHVEPEPLHAQHVTDAQVKMAVAEGLKSWLRSK